MTQQQKRADRYSLYDTKTRNDANRQLDLLIASFAIGIREVEERFPHSGIGDTETDEAIAAAVYAAIHYGVAPQSAADLHVGDKVMIYEDPITRFKPEGVATLKAQRSQPDGQMTYWWVEFKDYPGLTVARSVYVGSSNQKDE